MTKLDEERSRPKNFIDYKDPEDMETLKDKLQNIVGELHDKYNRKFIIYAGGISGGLSCFLIIPFHNPVMVLILCCGIGIAVGSMFGTIWALTNDVISRKNAGKQIGLLSFGFLFSGIAARGAGIIIDYLNNINENLGYFSLIGLAGFCFIIAPITASMIKTNNGN